MIANLVDNCLRNARLLFAPACVLCGDPAKAHADLCAPCHAALPRLGAACPCCANRLAGTEAALCGACQQLEPAFHATRAVFRYEHPVDSLLHGLKYHGRLDLARVLGILVATELASRGEIATDVLVPVPLDRSRLRERGYNQSLELARPIARRLGLPLDPFGVARNRPTRPQTELSCAERRKNVRGAFSVTNDFSGKNVAIVDDVMTSGATADALAAALKQAGARQVEVWVVARA